jgi:predicted MPP superfamily phosphohydrolase
MLKPGLFTRRRFLKLGLTGTVLAAGSTYAYTWQIEPYWVEVVRRDLPIDRLPAALAGRTLVQISDLHAGPEVADGYLVDCMERVSALRPDLLVITGDFMTCDHAEEIDRTIGILRHLRPARLATLAILGNHDYGRNHRQVLVAQQLTQRLDKLGIDVLRNARRDVAGLTVAGLDDLESPCFQPRKVLPTLETDRANLVLCHNPDAADKAVWGSYKGWILCGHTHGGQCKPPLLSPPILPVKNKRYVAGEIDLYDGRRLYINRGLGHHRQVRFNVRPEITVFTLRPR